jgi:hypothetical protein
VSEAIHAAAHPGRNRDDAEPEAEASTEAVAATEEAAS